MRHARTNCVLRSVCLFALAASLGLASPGGASKSARAEDFRVDTQVYERDEKQPLTTNGTVFHGNLIWDFAGDKSEIVLFDQGRHRFVLMDLGRQVKTEVTTESIQQFAQQLHDWAAAQNDPLLKFCATPRLDRTAGSVPGSLKFSSAFMTYQVETKRPEKPEMVSQYREFSDWYARLNVLFHPGTLPPFARMAVNEQLNREGFVPVKVQLTIPPQKRFGNHELVLRSEHDFRQGLTQSDINDMEVGGRYNVTFRTVTLGEYRQQEQAAAPAKSARR